MLSTFADHRPHPWSTPSPHASCPTAPRHAFMPSPLSASSTPTPPRRTILGSAGLRNAQNTAAERRRGAFLRKVRGRRDDRAWEGRAEDLARLDRAEWVQERRREEEMVLRDAPETEAEEEEGWGEEVEDVARREEMEVDALVSLMKEEEGGSGLQHPQQLGPGQARRDQTRAALEVRKKASSHFESDDEQYDELFAEMLWRQGQEQQHHHTDAQQDDVMDTGL